MIYFSVSLPSAKWFWLGKLKPLLYYAVYIKNYKLLIDGWVNGALTEEWFSSDSGIVFWLLICFDWFIAFLFEITHLLFFFFFFAVLLDNFIVAFMLHLPAQYPLCRLCKVTGGKEITLVNAFENAILL